MINKLFIGIPNYVKFTIFSQVRYLLNSPNFNRNNDLEDIIQELLLFYLDKFYKKDVPSEAYIVKSIQNEAKRLMKTKVRERFGLSFSLEDLTECPDELMVTSHFESAEINLLLSAISKNLSYKENLVIKMILDGKTIDDIARTNHMAKATIYKIFEKIKNF